MEFSALLFSRRKYERGSGRHVYKVRMEKNMIYDVIIIGSGPAGLSAAIYAQRARLKTLVLEKEMVSGGQIINTTDVDNYPGLPGVGGFELGQKFRDHAQMLGVSIVQEEVEEIQDAYEYKKIVTKKQEYLAKTVLIATGANHRKLGVAGEEELCGMGVSYCATCDGAFFRNKVTAVVGGGNVALEDALFLSKMCSKVYLIHRRDAFRGAKILQERIQETENIEILYQSQVTEICGEDCVEKIRVQNSVTGQSSELAVDGVFIAVGILPNSQLVNGYVPMDEGGYLIAGEDGVTKKEGIFAAGDVRTKELRQVITAASDGANCISSIEKYLNLHQI